MYKFNHSPPPLETQSGKTRKKYTTPIPKYILMSSINHQHCKMNHQAKQSSMKQHATIFPSSPLRGFKWKDKSFPIKNQHSESIEVLTCLIEWSKINNVVMEVSTNTTGNYEITDETVAANICREVSVC